MKETRIVLYLLKNSSNFFSQQCSQQIKDWKKLAAEITKVLLPRRQLISRCIDRFKKSLTSQLESVSFSVPSNHFRLSIYRVLSLLELRILLPHLPFMLISRMFLSKNSCAISSRLLDRYSQSRTHRNKRYAITIYKIGQKTFNNNNWNSRCNINLTKY